MTSSRREFLCATGAAASIAFAKLTPAVAQTSAKPKPAPDGPHAPPSPAYRFFNATEAAFMEAATTRLIPPDDTGPSAMEAGVVDYIDGQLAGAWGAGERLYRSGPWQPGSPSQGYQLPLTPAELFRNAIRAIGRDLANQGGRGFADLAPAEQDAYLSALEAGKKDLDGIPSKTFFETLLEMTVQGYFADPAYGGNRGMAAWEMIGFPGAYANYYPWVDKHGMAFLRRPMSFAENGAHRVHVEPNISAYAPARKSK